MTEKLANNAQTTLVDAINDVDNPAVFNVAIPDRFPTSGNFRVIVDDEILLVTGVSGNQFTASRAQESTVIAAHAAGTKITHVLTAGGTQQFVDERILIFVPSQTGNNGKFLQTNGTTTTWKYAKSIVDVVPDTPGLYDEEFDGALNTLPTNWSWAVAPSGSDSWSVNKPSLPSWLTVYGTGNANYFLTRSNFTPSGNFGIWCKCLVGPSTNSVSCNFRMYVYNSTKTEGRCIEIYPPQNNPSFRALKTISNSESAWSSGAGYAAGAGSTVYYLGLTRSSSNVWRAWGSNTGLGYQAFGDPETHSFSCDKIEFTFWTANGIKSLNGLDWVRYRSDLDFPIF
jgi:hypothetical protein